MRSAAVSSAPAPAPEIAPALLRLCFEAASQAILAISADGRIRLANRRTEEMFGYLREDLIGQPIEILLPKRYQKTHVENRKGYFTQPRVRPMGGGRELAGRRKNGTEFPVEVGLSWVRTAEESLAIGLVSDISSRKEAADELDRLNTELLRINAELEQFAYVASHDLQEPLRMVVSYLQLLDHRRHSTLDPETREYIGYAVDGAKRMQNLIRDLLRFSRAGSQAVFPQKVAVTEILRQVVGGLGVAIQEKNAEVKWTRLPEVTADPGLLTYVFQNLISNGIKFNRSRTPKVQVSAKKTPRVWEFVIEDNGIGIAARHAKRIFGLFERLHGSEEYPGTGIGLAIAARIVERHGGEIWVKPGTRKGSSFHFTLPLVAVPPKAAKTASPPSGFLTAHDAMEGLSD